MKKKNTDNIITDEERRTQDAGAVAEYSGEKSNRAKLVDFIGDDYDDTPVKDNSFAGRAGNFFYHYKWYLIIGALFLVIAAIGIAQMMTSGRIGSDVSVLYAGDAIPGGEQQNAITEALSSVLREDIDGDGERKVFLYTSYYAPGTVVTSASGKQIELSDKGYADDKLQGLIATGECGVMFLHPTLFEVLKKEGAVEKLEDVLGYEPEGAVDEYGVRLGDTDPYLYFSGLRSMPSDTVVCMRTLANSVFTSEKEAKAYHDAAEKLFKDYFGFVAPEDTAAD